MASVNDVGVPGQPLNTPPLTAWQAAVRDALGGSDIPVGQRAGAIVHASFAAIPDIAVTTTGVRDLTSNANGTTFPYPTTSIAFATMYGGFATGTTDFVHDLYGFAAAAVVRAAPSMQSVAAKYASSPLVWGWTNAANANVGYKSRVNVTAFGSAGTFHSGGSQLLIVLAN